MNPAISRRLLEVAAELDKAEHGKRSMIFACAGEELGLSKDTLRRKLREITVQAPRKRRADAGQSGLSHAEAQAISAALKASTRKNGKQLLSIESAVEMLRTNEEIQALALDKSTGELRPMSTSAIDRALRAYGLHPKQINVPVPSVQLASLHPNHVWQIDASICTKYYLPRSGGLKSIDEAVYYKNKPGNLTRIERDRLWRYVITDHASGWVYVEYVLGAESGENLLSVLINAMQHRDRPGDIMHGVPKILMLDPGAANTSAMARNLARSLGIELSINKPGNPRAKGQVEQAHNLVERDFEACLKFQDINNLSEINERGAQWRAMFNAGKEHSRHGVSRSSAWLRIRDDQLIVAPSAEICRDVALSAPEERKVSGLLRITCGGHEYDVSTIPGISVGEKIRINKNPWRGDALYILTHDNAGREIYLPISRVEKDEFGFAVDSPVIGQNYKRHTETPAQIAVKQIEQIITGTTNQADAEAARKANAPAFGGRIDPYKTLDEAVIPTYMPRRGTEHELSAHLAARFAPQPLTIHQAIDRLMAMGVWKGSYYRQLCNDYPADRVPEEDIDAIADRINRRPTLKVVGG